MRLWAACACAVAVAGPAWANSAAAPRSAVDSDAAAWLQRATNAARNLNYTGLIVAQHGTRIEISRITHLADATGEHEKLANLDGPPHEIVRNNDEVSCFYPNPASVRIGSRVLLPTFPSLLPAQIATLTQNYNFKKAELDRVAGLDAQAYIFEPKDNLRYARKLWADVASGLLLKLRTLNEANETLDQFMFSDIQIGGRIDKDAVKPRFASVAPTTPKKAGGTAGGTDGNTGWQVKDLPPGFTVVGDAYRSFPGRQEPVAHLLLSDGLVTVSVFVERLTAIPQNLGLTRHGGMNVYSRQWEDYMITVLGDAPEPAVQRIAFAVGRR
jgi:sigma-E factor negative regulatory protein RseB